MKKIATLQSKKEKTWDIARLKKAKIWNKVRIYPVSKHYRWITHDGEALRPCEMQIHHLFNAYKLAMFAELPKVFQAEKKLNEDQINLRNELLNRSWAELKPEEIAFIQSTR